MSDLTGRLQIKDSMKGQVINRPRDVALDVPRTRGNNADFAIVFVRSAADIRKLAPRAAACILDDGLLWLCYPKKSSGVVTDISRDSGWEPLSKLGYRGVRAVSIDDTWSALRFRQNKYVKTR